MTDENPPILAARGITVSFRGVDVVKNVDLNLLEGKIHALSGENGAGKSSLAKVFAGVYQPSQGGLVFRGRPVKFGNPREALRHGIALIHQEPLTFPDLDVAENIFVGHHPLRSGLVQWDSLYAQAKDILNSLGIDLNPRSPVGRLSVAQQQMVELACAMSHQAKVWIFDETTAPLTSKETDELFVIMRRLKEQGCAIAMVTHHMEEIWAVADTITVLRDGVKVGETSPSACTIPDVVRLMVGRDLSGDRPVRSEGTGATVLNLEHVSGPGFSDISLSVAQGEIVGVAGLVGAGRTELAKAIFGVTEVTSGTVALDGVEVAIRSPRDAIARGMGLVPEDRQHDGLFGSLSVAFNTTLAKLSRLSFKGWLSGRRLATVSAAATAPLRLSCTSQEQPAYELSGGNQQKIVLSKWLMTEPKLLILDEPTRGVDVGAKQEVHNLIREQASRGLGVLLMSSDLQEVLAISDRILVMRNGRIVAAFDGATATQEHILLAATGQEVEHGA